MGGEWWPWIVVLFGMIARADLNHCSLSLSLHHTVAAVVLLSKDEGGRFNDLK